MNRAGHHHARGLRALTVAAAAMMASVAVPAAAAPGPSARLVRCGEESCLRISGQRESVASVVLVNGRAVEAQGERRWQVHLPVDTVRDWSAPYARSIEVSLYDPVSDAELGSAEVDLPIGLLGGVTELASLVVSAR